MKTATAAAFLADRVINNSDCAERILSIVYQLREEIKNREADFQSRLKQAVEETRQCAQEQSRVEQARAVSAAHEYQSKLKNAEQLNDQLKENARNAENEWRAERRNLQEKIAALECGLNPANTVGNARMQSAPEQECDNGVHGEVAAIVQSEMVRVQLHLDEIERTLADPATELACEIRLNRERAELEAYLKGLRYSLGEVTLQPFTVDDSTRV